MKRTWIPSSVALLSICAHGCASVATLGPAALEPGATVRDARVVTREGLEYLFERVTCGPDSLIGTYRVLIERESGRDEIYYEEVERRHPIARADVIQVTTMKRDPGKALLAGAGIAAVAFFVKDLTTNDADGQKGGAQTKPDPR